MVCWWISFARRRTGFWHAQRQAASIPAYNAAIAGSQPLTFFPTLPSNGSLTNATALSYLQTGDVGTLAQFYQTNGLNGNVNFFPNPNALALNYTSNGADSTFNSLQLDARKRYSNGLTLQAKTTPGPRGTFEHAGSTQTNFEPLLDNANPLTERASDGAFDDRHVFRRTGYGSSDGTGIFVQSEVSGTCIGRLDGGEHSCLAVRFTVLDPDRRPRYAEPGSTFHPQHCYAVAGRFHLTNNVVLRFAGNGPYFFPASSIGTDGRGVAARRGGDLRGAIVRESGCGKYRFAAAPLFLWT